MNAVFTALYFADALSGQRALQPDESNMLADLINRARLKATRRRWDAADDRKLMRMKRRGMKAPEIGEVLGRTPFSVRCRIRDLRKREVRAEPAN